MIHKNHLTYIINETLNINIIDDISDIICKYLQQNLWDYCQNKDLFWTPTPYIMYNSWGQFLYEVYNKKKFNIYNWFWFTHNNCINNICKIHCFTPYHYHHTPNSPIRTCSTLDMLYITCRQQQYDNPSTDQYKIKVSKNDEPKIKQLLNKYLSPQLRL